jgi:tRNA 2-thiouridine synthesizing protein A
MGQTIVVIGGAGGGPVAASRAREFDENARIVLVEKKPHVSWVQAGLRHHLEGKVQGLEELDRERSEFFSGRHRIEVRTSTEAIRLDADARRVVLKTDAGTEALRFDAVVFSGGAVFPKPDVPGLEGPGLVSFRTLDDLNAIRAAIAGGAKRAVVLGCGPFGLDAAEGLRAAGLSVDVVERRDRILPSLSLLGARAAAKLLLQGGTKLHLREELLTAERRGNGWLLTCKSGLQLEADIVVNATGLRPQTRLLSEAGASLNADGSVRVNAQMQTTLPRVFACGTAVSVPHAVTRTPLWLPTAAIATRTAMIAGRSAAVGDEGVKESLSPVAGSALYLVGGQRFGRTGLSDNEARAMLGDDRVLAITIHGYAAEPWIGGDAICLRMVVDKQRKVVVGGEVWGREGVPRRLDVLAAAVIEGWSPARCADLDVAYAPNLGPAFDPVNAAGQFAELTLQGEANPLDAEQLALRVLRQQPMCIVDVGRAGRKAKTPWPEGTKQILLEELREKLDELPRDKPIVVVSHTGQRAYVAYRILRQRGFKEVLHLDGGALSYALTLDG